MNETPFMEFLISARRNANFLVGAFIIASVVFVAVLAPVLAPYGYDEPHKADRLQPPSAKYPFGTDDFGRDMLSKVIYGARITLQIALIGTFIQMFLGVTIGMLSGYFGGLVDKVLMYIADLAWCIPGIILALAVVTLLGKGLNNSIIAISLVNWTQFARIVRAKTMAIKNQAFIETGIAFGEKAPTIMLRYIFPNIVPALIVMISLQLPSTVISTTALSFLGLGSQPPSPDWGLALSNGMKYVSRGQWLSIFPGIALVYTVFGFNLLGEGVRDLIDPRMKSH
ncbi:MAG: ABC transporter permease [Synergistaceae bacterium]|jgi:peptide/nickel transport system permease protein|nr:ABC transporter permease [Synergistaceae bacterium]